MTHHAPHVFWNTRKADLWAMDHNPHPIGSDDAKAWQKQFWDDQTARLDRITGAIIGTVIIALTLPLIVSVVKP